MDNSTSPLIRVSSSDAPIDALKKLISSAFPDCTSLNTIDFNGSYEQAWQVYSRLLGVDQLEMVKKIAPLVGYSVVEDLSNVPESVVGLLPFNFCQANNVLPVKLTDAGIQVATANPFDQNVAERVRFLANRSVQWVLAPPGLLSDSILSLFSKSAERQALPNQIKIDSDPEKNEDSIVRLGRALLETAVKERASDIHIQPYMGSSVVRIRVDGELRRLTVLTDVVAGTLIRHIKARSGIDSTNTLIPQDGRMSMVVNDRDYDLRISTLPASRGERLVIRLLDQGQVIRLSESGFSLAEVQLMRRQIARPSGLIVITGPTGSGKTSTLYSLLSELNSTSRNIITVENPVEYRMPGISQVEVNEKAGRGFGEVLRSILRQDPDVILIGEIRDTETAEIALRAALTGHLVFSTLHTNDALTTIPRLLDLGVEPTVLSDALIAVASQRLSRKLCEKCKVPVAKPYSRMEKYFFELTKHYPGARPVGCEECSYTGYRGRLPLMELIEVDPPLREAISSREMRLSKLQSACQSGLKSLAADGGLQIISGNTTISEVCKSIGHQFWSDLANYYGAGFDAQQADQFLESITENVAVVLISENQAQIEELAGVLTPEGYSCIATSSAEEANEVFKQNDNVSFVIFDLSDNLTLGEAIETLQNAGKVMYWSRLPAMVLVPGSLANKIDDLHDHGVISPCLVKPAAAKDVLLELSRHKAR
ncbi:GspE/PulE family protein [Porticoccaceae bacterium LTM1]|nr:GspE/PulE family protein [Porticoccaceae bacterium LTM1]